MRRLATGILTALLLSGAMSPVAASGAVRTATAHWSLQHAQNPHAVSLESVSCASATACTATGAVTNNNISSTAAENWNGTAWTAEPTAAIPGGSDSFLRGVACTGPASCTAVGQYWNGSKVVTLAEHWNGMAWSMQPTPVPANSRGSFLLGVSCTGPAACTAVGNYIKPSNVALTLAERWNGTAWSIQRTPNPAGTREGVLDGVSCASARACTAVGQASDAAGIATTLAEQWNGSAWSVQPTPNPAGAGRAGLTAVSCTAATVCTAVGEAASTSTMTLAEIWTGTAWSIQPTPNPSGAMASFLTGVSCTAGPVCTAAGQYLTQTNTEVSMALARTGTAWSLQRTIQPGSAASSFLSAVSCTSATDCTAVGNYINTSTVTQALIERHSAS